MTAEAPSPAAKQTPDAVPPVRDRAAAVRETAGYDGTMTAGLLQQLYPLLAEATPDRYIKRTKATKGKPFESTGVRSVQVQVDRMNDVVGLAHWRVLYHYNEDGTVCRCVAVIGNDLGGLTLTDDGQLAGGGSLDVDGAPVVLAVREGWGGHERGSSKGDLYKGAETNALKRTLARFGPGADVYRLDPDDDVQLADQPKVGAPAGPPALEDELAVEQQAQAKALFKELKELDTGGLSKDFTPARFQLYLASAAHSHERLDAFLDHLRSEIARVREQREGVG